jgi:hypothetical protein
VHLVVTSRVLECRSKGSMSELEAVLRLLQIADLAYRLVTRLRRKP